MIFTTPYWLLLLPLALLPFLAETQAREGYPGLDLQPIDGISSLVKWGLRLAGVLGLAGLVLGLAGVGVGEGSRQVVGHGSHVVLLIDRSSSMDNTFAGRQPDGSEESKSAAARRILKDFVMQRPGDRVGVAAFSTSPMQVVPLTNARPIILAAIDAIGRPGLAFTDVGRGLAMAMSMHGQEHAGIGRSVVLVSDGAAVIDRRLQDKLRAEFARQPINLYWLYLRTAGSKGIFEQPASGEEDTPQALPERHLNKFFESLHVPYRAFEAESPQAVADAVAAIDKLERRPAVYTERVPGIDLSHSAYGLAAAAMALLLMAKLFERSLKIEGGRRGN